MNHRPRQSALPLLPVPTDCSGCGVCCLHMGYPAFILPTRTRPGEAQWDRLPHDLKQELLDYMAQYRVADDQLDGPCIWFDLVTRRCKHHQYRPRVCREFAVGGLRCREWRHHYRDKIAI